MKKQMSLIIQLIDDFRNEIIKDFTIQPIVEQGKRPIWKEEGYYIFTDIPGTEYSIIVNAIGYGKQKIFIKAEQLPEKMPLLKIRLFPDCKYNPQEKVTWMKGKAQFNSIVMAYCQREKSGIRLFSDYQANKDGKEIVLYHKNSGDFTGKHFLLVNKETKEIEQIQVVFQEMTENYVFRYQIKEPLNNNYKKENTAVLWNYETQVKEDGTYSLPIKRLTEEVEMYEVINRGKIVIQKECMLQAGKNNYINFIEGRVE